MLVSHAAGPGGDRSGPKRHPPHLPQQLCAAAYALTAPPHQRFQQGELGRRQLHLAARLCHPALGTVHLQIAKAQHRVLELAAPPAERLQARAKLMEGKRLHHNVVGPESQTLHPLRHLGPPVSTSTEVER